MWHLTFQGLFWHQGAFATPHLCPQRIAGHQGTPGSDAVNGEKCCGVVRPLVICYIAIEAMAPVEIVDLSIKSDNVPVRKL